MYVFVHVQETFSHLALELRKAMCKCMSEHMAYELLPQSGKVEDKDEESVGLWVYLARFNPISEESVGLWWCIGL